MRRLKRGVLLVWSFCWLLAACALPVSSANNLITFGAAISLTGKTFKEGESVRDGYQLWIETINSRGGLTIAGQTYRVALRYYDDESRPERTAALVEQLIVEDQVDFLLGPYATEPTAAAAAVAERYHVPLIDSNGAAEAIFKPGYRYTFGVLSPARHYLRGIIDLALAKTTDIHTVAILGNDDGFSRESANGAAEYAISQGLTVAYLGFYPTDAQDISAYLQEIAEQQPDLLLGAGHLQDTLLIVKQARLLGLTPKVIGFSVGPTAPKFREHLRHDADYIFGATQWTSALKYRGDDLWGTPENYTAAFKARYPHYREVPYHAAQSSAALVAYQRALEVAGSTDRELVRDALAQLDMTSFYGRIKFDQRGINIYKPMVVEQLQPDGGKYTVFPLEVAEREALFASTDVAAVP